MDKNESEKEISMQLIGTPEEISPHIIRTAKEFRFPQGFNCDAQEESYESSQSSKHLTIYRITDAYTPGVTWMHAKPEELPKKIGSITLQTLKYSNTLFIAENNHYGINGDGSDFNIFLKRLSQEFKQLGLEVTVWRKVWNEFKDIFTSIIAKFAAEKTKGA